MRLLPSPTAPDSAECRFCGLQNEATRRFCRHCGEWLVQPSWTPAATPDPLRSQLRRRWGGDRGPYSGRLSRATIVFRTLVTTVTLLVVTLVLTLVGFHPIQRVRDEIGHVRGSGRLTEVAAVAEPAGGPLARTAPWAVDDVRARGWTTQWTAATAGDPDAACPQGQEVGGGAEPASGGTAAGASATDTALVLTFGKLVDVREIGIEPGLLAPAERDVHWQPRTLELRWSGGGCQRVNLERSPGLQRFGVHQKEVSGVRVAVIAGYEPVDPGSNALDIGEITLWHR